MRTRALSLFLAGVCAACGPEAGARKSQAPTPTQAPAPTSVRLPRDQAGQKPELRDANQVVAEALSRVAALRQLPAKGPVKGKTISRGEMVDYVRRELRKEVPEPVIIAQNELLYALGTVPATFDYEKSLLELMGAELAGFYDPEDKTMYLGRDLSPAERDATLAHELVHALQDQHYDLDRRIRYRDDATDEQSAVHALAEGDATSAMIDHVLAPRGLTAIDVSEDLFSLEARGSIEMSPGSAGVPSIMKRSVVSPYTDGLLFVNGLRRSGGWPGVDRVWQNPPTTTEQLLHPEKLAKREGSEAIAIPAPPVGGPSTVIYHDILGEQSVRLLFEEWMPRKIATESASDWSGDRVAVLRDGNRFALAWHLRYDTQAAASRGLEAFARGILLKPGAAAGELVSPEQAHKAASSGSVCRERASAGPFAAIKKNRELVLVGGPYRRLPDGPKSAAGCAAAVKWASAIADQN